MNLAEFDRVADTFAAFHAQFARFFGRTEARRRSEQYLRGLLVQQTDRRNAKIWPKPSALPRPDRSSVC